MNAEEKFLVIGRVGSAFGVKGWVKIISFCDPQDNIVNYEPWFLSTPHGFEPIVVLEKNCRGDVITAHFDGCDDRDKACLYTNRDIAITRQQLPMITEKDEYYWIDLEKLTVIDQQGETLGTVDHLYNTGANDVMVVKGKKEYLIPFLINRTVTAVDLEAGVIRVDWDSED